MDHGLDPLDAMTIPCITMTDTHPTFHLVPVTRELENAIITGQYSATQTRVIHGAPALVQKARSEVIPRFQGTCEKPLGAYFGGGFGDVLLVFEVKTGSELLM